MRERDLVSQRQKGDSGNQRAGSEGVLEESEQPWNSMLASWAGKGEGEGRAAVTSAEVMLSFSIQGRVFQPKSIRSSTHVLTRTYRSSPGHEQMQ